MALTPEEIERYKRHLVLREVMDALYKQAAIERAYVHGQCAVPLP